METFARLRGWAEARTSNPTNADKVLRIDLAKVQSKDRGDFIVNELAPAAVRMLAQNGRAAEAAKLLTALAEFQPTPRSDALGFSHARELAQLRQDLTTYASL